MRLKKILMLSLAAMSTISLASCSSIQGIISGMQSFVPTNTSTATSTSTSTEAEGEIDENAFYDLYWLNDDGTVVLYMQNVKGSDVEKTSCTIIPTKEADEKYSYTFEKWVEEIDLSQNEITYTATYSRTSLINEDIYDWGYNDLQNYDNKEDLISLYYDIDEICESFYNGDITTETKEINYSDGTKEDCIIIGGDNKDIDYSKYSLTAAEAKSVYSCVLLDNPQYYFTTSLITGYTQTTSGGVVTSRTDYLNICVDEEYSTVQSRVEYKKLIDDYMATVKEEVENLTNNVKKVKTIHDYIINNAKYAFEEDGITPDDSSYSHNILGIIKNKKGVCESYAELFQLLLLDNGINCIRVTGYGNSEQHAWNYASVDGDWYAFDVTWDDPVASSGSDTLIYDYFGKGSNNSTFMKSHSPYVQGDFQYGLNYLYTLPTLSTSDIQLSIFDVI